VAHVQAGRPERTVIISRTRGYHGTNYGGTSAQGIAPNKVGYGTLLEDVIQVDADDIEAMSVAVREEQGPPRRDHLGAGAGRGRCVPQHHGIPAGAAAAVRRQRRCT